MKSFAVFCSFAICFFAACNKDSNKPAPFINSFSPAKGSAYNSIIIKGGNFGEDKSAVSVTFNGAHADIDSLHDTIIYVKVPVNATTGKILVTANTLAVSSADDFIILAGTWIRKADVPTPGGWYQGIAFSINGKGYFGMGTSGGPLTGDLYEYDPATNTWSQKASCPDGLMHPFCMVINNKAYIGTGESSSGFTPKMWEYDPDADKWTQKADFPGTPNSSIYFGVGVVNKGYAGFGNTKHWWEYDPLTDTWTPKADFPGDYPLEWAAGFALNGIIYTGIGAEHPTENYWWQYDPPSDTWTQKNDFPGEAIFAGSFIINNIPYIVGGGSECWKYDVSSDTWEQMAFYGPRYVGAAFAIDDKGYYMTGNAGPEWLQHDLWQFTPPQ